MAKSTEILIPESLSRTGLAMLTALSKVVPASVVTHKYEGNCDNLMLYGVGAEEMSKAHKKHLSKGHVVLWDQGYFGRKKIVGYLRASIDHWHPQAFIGRTTPNPDRWRHHGISLRNDYAKNGPIILVGIPPKSRVYLGAAFKTWEQEKYKDLCERYPTRKIIYRPKPKRIFAPLPILVDSTTPIEQLIAQSSLVVVRHSNVAIDAIIAGIPIECEDGAAMWIKDKVMTDLNRLDFLYRLAYWQWHPGEAKEAWDFLSNILEVL